jgi:hypothetical protein
VHIREFAKLMRIKGSGALPGGVALATRPNILPGDLGSFNTQNRSIGPTLYITFGGDDDSKGGDDDEGKPEVSEFTMNVGLHSA